MPEVKLTEEYGFCFGVRRALEIARRILKEGKSFDSLGPIIHNEYVVDQLRKEGVEVVNNIEESKKNLILVRTHGVPPEIYDKAKSLGKDLIDCTCPFVSNAQKWAKKFYEEGYVVIVIGKRDHPEVVGIVGHTGGNAIVVSSSQDLSDDLIRNKKVGVVAQTTSRLDVIQDVINKLVEEASEVRFANTRCNTTQKRQEQVEELSKEVEVIVIVGGKNSSNTRRLFEIASRNCKKAYLVSSSDELSEDWFYNVKSVGVSGGASTPPEMVEEVYEKIKKFLGGGGYGRGKVDAGQ
ncbi:MAG: 4-hydroxy-3-methylbut-2-enyl diphosphate reductase [bacterium]|nr:4-hydroxy-3-methylbut-2-enyl diphosphate reductase [bacterium]